MTTITLTNDFHNTSVTLRASGNKLSRGQMLKAKRALCCDGCGCSGDFGYRGPQDGIDGIEPIYNSRLGEVEGGVIHWLGE